MEAENPTLDSSLQVVYTTPDLITAVKSAFSDGEEPSEQEIEAAAEHVFGTEAKYASPETAWQDSQYLESIITELRYRHAIGLRADISDQTALEIIEVPEHNSPVGLHYPIPPALPITKTDRGYFFRTRWKKMSRTKTGEEHSTFYPIVELGPVGEIEIRSGLDQNGNGIDFAVLNPEREVKSWYDGEVVRAGTSSDSKNSGRVTVKTSVTYTKNGRKYRVYQSYGNLRQTAAGIGRLLRQGDSLGNAAGKNINLRTFIIEENVDENLALDFDIGVIEINPADLEKQLMRRLQPIKEFSKIDDNNYEIGDGRAPINPSGADFHALTGAATIVVSNNGALVGRGIWNPEKQDYIMVKRRFTFRHGQRYHIRIPMEAEETALEARMDKILKRKRIPPEVRATIRARVVDKTSVDLLAGSTYSAHKLPDWKNRSLQKRFKRQLQGLDKKMSASELCLFVDGHQQKLYLVRKNAAGGFTFTMEYKVSTGRRGYGNEEAQTPLGTFTIPIDDFSVSAGFGEVISHRAPIQVFKNELRDWRDSVMLTSAFYLEETPKRGIAIHGTNEEGHLGEKKSDGCIRISNLDILDLATLLEQEVASNRPQVTVHITNR